MQTSEASSASPSWALRPAGESSSIATVMEGRPISPIVVVVRSGGRKIVVDMRQIFVTAATVGRSVSDNDDCEREIGREGEGDGRMT